MKKLIVSIIIMGLLLCTSSPSLGENETIKNVNLEISLVKNTPKITVSGNTLYVGGSGLNNYTTIQGAINDAVDGDTVFVYDDSSPYYENIVVDESIILIGEERDSTIIDGGKNGNVVTIEADGATVRDFMIINSKCQYFSYEGVSIYESSNCVMLNNIIKENEKGIELVRSENCIIEGNIITNLEDSAIKCYNSDYAQIIGNVISNHNGYWGVRLENSDCCAVYNNSFSYNLGILVGTDNNLIKYNEFGENIKLGIFLSKANYNQVSNNQIINTIEGCIFSQENCNYNVISNNTISNNAHDGIVLFDRCENNRISNNTISNNAGGISLFGSSNNNIVCDNLIDSNHNYAGVGVYQCNNVRIKRNQIVNNNDFGVEFSFSNHCLVEDNNISNNTKAGIWGGDRNVHRNNFIKSNGWAGIFMGSSMGRNLIVGNKIISNSAGIKLSFSHSNIIADNIIESNSYHGIHFVEAKYNVIFRNNLSYNSPDGIHTTNSFYWSIDNRFYHNNFIGNSNNAHDECSNNSWDNGYSAGGNYWDDYTGEDDNGDGYGDTPYEIPGGDSQDNYPLMHPYYISENLYPYPPLIYGPTNGESGEEYEYTFLSLDPDDDYVYYFIDWGDGSYTDWFGPYSSGEEIARSHTWDDRGEYTIRAKAKDIYGAESDWATLPVTMPVNQQNSQSQPSSQQSPNSLFFQILQRLMNIR